MKTLLAVVCAICTLSFTGAVFANNSCGCHKAPKPKFSTCDKKAPKPKFSTCDKKAPKPKFSTCKEQQ